MKFKSIDSELAALRDQLGRPPLLDVVSGVQNVRYQVAPGNGERLVQDFMQKTNYKLSMVFQNKKTGSLHYLMNLPNSAIGIVIEEPKKMATKYPRLIGITFKVTDLNRVKDVLKSNGVSFSERVNGIVTDSIPGLDDTFAYMEKDTPDWFTSDEFEVKEIALEQLAVDSSASKYLGKVGGIDHIAYRIRANDVKTAAINLMRFTGYQFSDCYTIGNENAETMVFRRGDSKPAIVASYGWDHSSVVWQYVEKYGPRVHHTAFYTEDVLNVVEYQMKQEIQFTTAKMIGSQDRGILQIFTTPSLFSHEITEYIERFHGFTGFFDKGNVGDLMRSTKSFN